MKKSVTIATLLLICGVTARAQWLPLSQTDHPAANPRDNARAQRCLIVKHKGTVGRRLMWTALIGVPIAPGAKYDYVDNINVQGTKLAYSGKELEAMQA